MRIPEARPPYPGGLLRNLFLAVVVLSASTAFASRMYITCDEGKNTKTQYTAHASYDPAIALETMWKKSGRSSYIVTYKQGKEDRGETTTARVGIAFPKGRVELREFYSVNVFGTQGYGDDVGPYRAFHGHDKDQQYDLMLYFSDAGLRESPKKFKGLLTFQPAGLEQGYYHINLVCSSRERN